MRINELLRTTLRYNKIYVYVRYNNAATPTEGDGSTCGVCMMVGDADGTNTSGVCQVLGDEDGTDT